MANLSKALQVSEIEILTTIGYTSENSEHSDSHEIFEGIHIVFQDGKKLLNKKRQEILEAARLVARGVMAGGDSE